MGKKRIWDYEQKTKKLKYLGAFKKQKITYQFATWIKIFFVANVS